MSHVSDQLELRVKRELRSIPESDYRLLTTEAAAVKYAVSKSGLQDKSLAYEVGTDPGTFSKAQAGQARLNETALDALMDATGIEAPLFAWLLRRGYDPRSLRRFESDLERENRELRDRLAERDAEREIELRLFRQLRAGA